MDYFEAQELLKNNKQYASPDFYRVMFADTIALGLRDDPVKILYDVEYNGTTEAKALLEEAIQCGYVQAKHDSTNDIVFHDVVDIENSGAPYYFRSHIAMQIAYPELYKKFFGEYVWNFSHPKMQELVDLCVSCLTNKKHPSDYYGRHEIESSEPKRGRPKLKKEVKKKDVGFEKWIEDCKKYKNALKNAWDTYMEACRVRKEIEVKAKAWRDEKMNALREEMKNVSILYEKGMEKYNNDVEKARLDHSNLKAKGKPKRNEYE